MEKIAKFSKLNPFPVKEIIEGISLNVIYEFSVYHTLMPIFAGPFPYYGRQECGTVTIKAYGLIIRKIFERNDKLCMVDYDRGPLSATLWHLNALVHELARHENLTFDWINQIIATHVTDWCAKDSRWGTPFGKEAENELKRELRERKGISIPPLDMTADNIRLKREKRFKKLNPFRSLTPPSTNGGVDA